MTAILDKITNFLCKLRISKKVLAVLFVIAFLLSLIPIVITAFYSVPTYDDYNFGYYTHKSVVEGTSFFAAILETMDFFYNNWQGFFSANLLAAIQPFNINADLYFISNLVAIFISIASLFYLLKVILCDLLKSNIVDYILISVPIVFLSVQFLPSIAEGFYWMDGSLSVVVYSILIFIFGFVIKYYLATTFKSKVVYFVLSVFFMLTVCGTGLNLFVMSELIAVVMLVYTIVKKIPVKSLLVTLMCIYFVGIMIALVAPGNNVRFTGNEGLSLIHSIFYGTFYSLVKFGTWTNLASIAILLFVSVIFYPIAKSSKYSFKKPFLVFLIMYCAFAATMAVQLKASGYLGAPRQMNAYYRTFLLMICGSVLYFVGWLSKRKEVAADFDRKKVAVLPMFIIFCVFCCGCLNYGVKSISFFSTSISLANRQIQTYNKEMKERIALYENDQISNVEVNELTYYPECFGAEPISNDTMYWTNRSVAKYYNKKSVKLVHSKDR